MRYEVRVRIVYVVVCSVYRMLINEQARVKIYPNCAGHERAHAYILHTHTMHYLAVVPSCTVPSTPCSSEFACLRRMKITAPAKRPTPARPPMTPPAIAPVLLFLPVEEEEPGVGAGVEHASVRLANSKLLMRPVQIDDATAKWS